MSLSRLKDYSAPELFIGNDRKAQYNVDGINITRDILIHEFYKIVASHFFAAGIVLLIILIYFLAHVIG